MYESEGCILFIGREWLLLALATRNIGLLVTTLSWLHATDVVWLIGYHPFMASGHEHEEVSLDLTFPGSSQEII